MKDDDSAERFVCAFCGEVTEGAQGYVRIDLSWPGSPDRQSLGAHGGCLRAAIQPGVPLGDGGEIDDDRFVSYEQAMNAAARRIRPARRRLTDEQAERIVAEEFSSRGMDLPGPTTTSIARSLLHPFWPFLHPLRARREGWRWLWRADWD